ncbi:LysR family transcriptional regulator [Actinocorallia sp. A-T 12471]|uniref:LysR family transcriptional regulator n=1 Tax=Actinocorallia sp. A-T 12471 TaxID=3089813 RepID=UPI0029D00EDE|nr:LysR family transcriptional regulator [Actinocorallia sp. A-T 12471]MDX6740209.1 LysR family transcriptional regulator [Actinocorallia sp. A-T 12471]
MNLANLDLNLVIALRALLRERNVTRAGERIGLSQPAMSAALSRLRRHFDDELLVRVRKEYELTPLGLTLLEPAQAACEILERVFSAQPDFDPRTADREFVLLTSDYALAVLGEELSRAVRAEAPGVRLRFPQLTAPAVDDLDTTLRAVDGLLAPHGIIGGYPAVDLFTDRWLCMIAEDSPVSELSVADLARLPWVDLYHRPTYTHASRQLGLFGIEPQVEVVVEIFQSLPFLIAGTDRVALIQERLARRFTGIAPVRTLDPPFDPVPLTEAMWWHPAHTRDAGHAWLRRLIADVGARIQAEG